MRELTPAEGAAAFAAFVTGETDAWMALTSDMTGETRVTLRNAFAGIREALNGAGLVDPRIATAVQTALKTTPLLGFDPDL